MNILITEKALKEYGICTEDILLNPNGDVYLCTNDDSFEYTDLIWNIVYTPCTKETQTIIITKKGEKND